MGGISAAAALTTYDRPVLLVHGDTDDVVPVGHHRRLMKVASAAGRSVESLVIPGGRHSWLYEFPEYRRTVASFLASTLGGRYSPEEAGERAAATEALRIPEGETQLDAVTAEPGGFRSLAAIALPDRRGDPPVQPGLGDTAS